MISFLVTLLIMAVVVYVLNLIIGMLSLPPVVKTIAYLIIGLVFLFYILNMLGLGTGLNMGAPALR